MPVPIVIQAVVDDVERPGVAAAADQLGESLAAAAGEAWPIDGHFRRSLAELDKTRPAAAIILSLLPDAWRLDEPVGLTEARWRGQLATLDAGALSSTFLCTVFRAVGEARASRATARGLAMIERIRRLNLLAVDLSHDIGINVIDIDRAFAHFGAYQLHSHFRPSGVMAEEVAGHAIVATLLAAGLGDAVPAAVLEKAKQAHGAIWDAHARIQRRVARRRTSPVAR